jgi:hypothetical protein
MYSLKCNYYNKEFTNLDDLIEDIMINGMDPNIEITEGGVGIGEKAIDFMMD